VGQGLRLPVNKCAGRLKSARTMFVFLQMDHRFHSGSLLSAIVFFQKAPNCVIASLGIKSQRINQFSRHLNGPPIHQAPFFTLVEPPLRSWLSLVRLDERTRLQKTTSFKSRWPIFGRVKFNRAWFYSRSTGSLTDRPGPALMNKQCLTFVVYFIYDWISIYRLWPQ
jgi:hypothetical protein